MFSDLVAANRSYRRFDTEKPILFDTVRGLIQIGSAVPSAGNLQRIRYAVVCEQELCARIFPLLSWAGYLKDWDGPSPEERPRAYIVMMTKTQPDTNLAMDIGIAAQTILLAATEAGLGGCMIRSFSSDALDAILGHEGYRSALVIALGVPRETVRLVSVTDGNIRYYREPDGTHCVPKYTADELIL